MTAFANSNICRHLHDVELSFGQSGGIGEGPSFVTVQQRYLSVSAIRCVQKGTCGQDKVYDPCDGWYTMW